MYMDTNQNTTEQATNQTNPYYQNAASTSYQQGNYQQGGYVPTPPTNLEEPISVLDWIGTILVLAIPCVGIIMYIVWAFSSGTKKSKSNYCKANLILLLVVIGLYLVIGIIAIIAAAASY